MVWYTFISLVGGWVITSVENNIIAPTQMLSWDKYVLVSSNQQFPNGLWRLITCTCICPCYQMRSTAAWHVWRAGKIRHPCHEPWAQYSSFHSSANPLTKTLSSTAQPGLWDRFSYQYFTALLQQEVVFYMVKMTVKDRDKGSRNCC